jgi:hypothetical protein
MNWRIFTFSDIGEWVGEARWFAREEDAEAMAQAMHGDRRKWEVRQDFAGQPVRRPSTHRDQLAKRLDGPDEQPCVKRTSIPLQGARGSSAQS